MIRVVDNNAPLPRLGRGTCGWGLLVEYSPAIVGDVRASEAGQPNER